MLPGRVGRTGRNWISSEAWPHAEHGPFAWGAGYVLSMDLVQYMAAGKHRGLGFLRLLSFLFWLVHGALAESEGDGTSPRPCIAPPCRSTVAFHLLYDSFPYSLGRHTTHALHIAMERLAKSKACLLSPCAVLLTRPSSVWLLPRPF
jgi:hypothetical protein